jgi:LuxR family maltose regulon positive regulatory protein
LLQHRLTLLLAPAGYGKTAALTRQIRQLPEGCVLAWVSADEDDQLQRFLACLTAALEPHDLPWRVAPEALATLALAERGLRDVAGELVNALASGEAERGLIVLDDAHRITDPRVFELLQLMLERLPEHWGLVIASRVEPPMALARLRAAGELAEFRQYDLRFSEPEIGALLSTSELGATPLSARELLQRTDGWAAGLRLSLSAVPRSPQRSGVATQRHVFDYLAAEVLDDMPEALREFLLSCSVLPELTARRCAQVSGMALAQADRLLDEVERRGLFVSVLEADELTLRLHDLFRDFLEDRLRRDHAELLPTLLRRAAEGEPDLSRAVAYLARAGAWDDAVRVLVERGPALVPAGGATALEQMLALFPKDAFDRHADLHMLRGLTTFPSFDFDAMVMHMQRAAAGYESAGRERDAVWARAYTCLGQQNTGALRQASAELQRLRALALDPAARAWVHFCSAWAAYAECRADDVAPLFAEMLSALEEVPDPQAWDACFFTSLMTGLPGMTALLERFAQGALRVIGEQPTQLRAGVHHAKAWLALAAGRLQEAADWLARADDDCRWLGRARSVMTENWMSHTLIDALRGDRAASYAAASENKHDLEDVALRPNRLTHEYEELFTYIRACWIFQDEPRLRELHATLERTGNPHEWAAAPDDRRFSQAFIALFDRRLDDALTLLQPLAVGVERSCFFPSAQACVMLADVQHRLGRTDAAAATLRQWLDRARQSNEIGGGLLAGPAVLQRLVAVPWGDRLSTQHRRLLAQLYDALRVGHGSVDAAVSAAPTPVAAGSGAAPALAVAAPTPAPDLAGLSEREREVLERMAAGDSNKLIARALDLSPHTVKRHVANILGKLEAETRGQAAARWRDMAGRRPR